MPSLQRPDGVQIHWETHGEGPLVVIVHHALWSYPWVYADLIRDVARDHRVIVYDPRGCGQSTRRGPYDPQVDADDLMATVEAAGVRAVAIAVGDGFNRGVRAAAARPDLISHLVAVTPAAAALLPRSELTDSGVIGASDSVVDMLLQMMRTDPRSALRTVLTAVNPGLDEDQIRDRVERVATYVSPEASLDRGRHYMEDDASEQARVLGDRLRILHGGTDPLFEGVLGARVAELFPNAHIEVVPDGPISRPDLIAAWVRRVTATAGAG
jgi:pimeloyl-ACP methyl ester carboxylesterase